MKLAEMNTLRAYNEWADRRILAPARGLSAKRLLVEVPGLSVGHLLGTLAHVYNDEYVCWKRYQEDTRVPSLTGDSLPC